MISVRNRARGVSRKDVRGGRVRTLVSGRRPQRIHTIEFERIARYLRPWHVGAFWLGFLFDVSGTWTMHRMAEGPFDLREPHTLTGQIALWLMLAHTIWATAVTRRSTDKARRRFHRYSLMVWLVRLVPYFG